MDEKGIWMVETTKENIHKAMQKVDKELEVLKAALPGMHFVKNSAFPVPLLIPNYGVSQAYTTQITSNVVEKIDESEKGYYRPPMGALSRGSHHK
eukprot:10536412-Ditylum_brightwellii.AAC.1